MSQGLNVKSYPVISASMSDIPQSMQSSSAPRVAPASTRLVQVAAQNGTQTSGGRLEFTLSAGQGSGFIVSGSTYLKCTVDVTQANAKSWLFAQYGSGSSILQRATLLVGGAVQEQIQNYNKLYSSLLLHAGSRDYASNDDKIYQNSFEGSAVISAPITVYIPIVLGLLNADQHFPLFLCPSVNLQFDLDTVAQAVKQIGADALTEYSVSNASLVYEVVQPDIGYEQALKSMLSQGRLYQIPFNTWYNMKFSNGVATKNQTIGLNFSSVKGVFWNSVTGEAIRNNKFFTSDAQTSGRLFLDGRLINSFLLDSNAQNYIELGRALNVLGDVSRTSIAPSADTANAVLGDTVASDITRDSYYTRAFWGGLSTSRSNESGFAMSGSPVNQAVLEVVNNGTAGTWYIYVANQQILTIDASMNSALIR